MKHTYRYWLLGKTYHNFKSFKVYSAYRQYESEYLRSLNTTKSTIKREPIIMTPEQKEFTKALSEIFNTLGTKTCVSYPDHTLGKWVNNEFIIKPSVQLKNLKTVWFEDANPEDIDTEYYNLDGTYKY